MRDFSEKDSGTQDFFKQRLGGKWTENFSTFTISIEGARIEPLFQRSNSKVYDPAKIGL